jgi:hypothetical protein
MGSKKLPTTYANKFGWIQHFVIAVTQMSFDIREAVAQKGNKRAG